MTVQEVDIIVEVNVKKALKEIEKILPAVKRQISGIQEEINKINVKDIAADIDMSKVNKKLEQTKQKIKETFEASNISKLNLDSNTIETTKLSKANNLVQSIKNGFSKIPNITKAVTNNIKKMGTCIKSGIGHVIKYASSLFSLNNIYTTLNGLAQNWLSSQNAEAKKLSANIEYMKYSIRKCISPNNTICNRINV